MKIDVSENGSLRNPYFGIGMEKLDRDAFDPSGVYDKVSALGVKWVRLQSGWAKTEKEKGKYDFDWLDGIVENLIHRDLTPWICLCYGNPLYSDRAKKICGAVGCPPIDTAEGMTAWKKYCATVAARYRGKAEYYEVWNEPDWLWNGKCEPEAYTAFCKETAQAVKEGDPNAKIIVGSVAFIDPGFLTKCLESGIGEFSDALSYHAYTYDERTFASLNAYYRDACKNKGVELKVIHGESGSQSHCGGNGAFKGIPASPILQAKHLLRQVVTDRLSGAFFSSYFTATDMHENLLAKAGKPIKRHGYFGVLSATFDKNGIACGPFLPKPSYFAYQNACLALGEDAESADFPFWVEKAKDDPSPVRFMKKLFCRKVGGVWHDPDLDRLTTFGLKKKTGSAFVYWESTDLLRKKNYSSYIDVTFIEEKVPKLFDFLTGELTDIPYEREGDRIRVRLPVRDYPLAVFFGNYL